MTSTPRLNADRLGLAVTALACVALTITSLGPASAAPAAAAMTTGPPRSVGVAATPDRPRRAPEPADTTGGLLYRTHRADFTPLREVPGAAFTAHIGLNEQGQITGGYRDASGRELGFLRDGHRYRTLDTPGGNIAWGINDRGEVVLPDPQVAGLLPVAT